MKQTLTFNAFHDAFRDYDRLDNFSYQGLRVLFDWFNEYDESCDHETELDVIAICCEFSESTLDEIISDYSVDISECEDEGERLTATLDHLNDHTMLCGETDSTIIFAAF